MALAVIVAVAAVMVGLGSSGELLPLSLTWGKW